MLKRKSGRPAANMTKDFAKLPGIMPNLNAVRYKSMDKIMRGGIEQIPLVLGEKEENMAILGRSGRNGTIFELSLAKD
jgi:hypothetical protein